VLDASARDVARVEQERREGDVGQRAASPVLTPVRLGRARRSRAWAATASSGGPATVRWCWRGPGKLEEGEEELAGAGRCERWSSRWRQQLLRATTGTGKMAEPSVASRLSRGRRHGTTVRDKQHGQVDTSRPTHARERLCARRVALSPCAGGS
jgi:hypothetical protein